MKRKKSKTLWIVLLFIILLLMVIASLYAVKIANDKATMYKQTADDIAMELENNTKFVYVVTEDLTKGTVLVEDENVEQQGIISSLPEEYYITEEQLGYVLTVDLLEGEPVMSNMVTEDTFTKDTREVEIGVATLMLNQAVNDYVDVRIMFPSGADYTVIPKLKIKNLSLENSIFYADLNENEILTLASATVDAYTTTGAKIYLTKYVESNLQEESKANYPVSNTVLSLIASDPNILEIARESLSTTARAEMEARLSNLTEEFFKAVAEGHGITDTAHASALVAQKTQEELDAQAEMVAEQ